jgi:hypothetical protein
MARSKSKQERKRMHRQITNKKAKKVAKAKVAELKKAKTR